MKACIIINHFQVSDGVARSAIGVANALSAANIDVTIIPLFKYDKEMNNRINSNVKVKPFIRFYFKGLAKLVDLIPDKILYKLVIRNNYDIEIGFCMTLPSKIIASSNNLSAKKYLWMHGYDEGLTLLTYYKKVHKVICVSKQNYERFLNETNGEIACDYAYNLLDDSRINKMGEGTTVSRTQDLTFVSVGRLSPEKGYLRLLRSLKRLKDNNIAFKLWLIGNGPQYNEINDEINHLGLNADVVLMGELSNPYPYVKTADLFVCSSFSEGYSTVCVEAVILGTPVLTTNVSGGREIIDDAGAGMLVENNDDELYKGLEYVANNPDVINTWARIISYSKEKFSYKARLCRLMNVLDFNN